VYGKRFYPLIEEAPCGYLGPRWLALKALYRSFKRRRPRGNRSVRAGPNGQCLGEVAAFEEPFT
jgi:hypothetical protein